MKDENEIINEALNVLSNTGPFRDLLKGMVAQFVDDGFTIEQARFLTCFQLGYRLDEPPEE